MKLSSRIVTTERTPIFFGRDAFSTLDRQIRSMNIDRRNIFILVDQNTRKHCLPFLIERSDFLSRAQILEIEGGEKCKSLVTAERLWNELLASGAGRDSLLVNLGGGVVSDLGGFVAAGYKRGIHYLNIPTSLMGQVDASIGGKTAINLGKVKNQVGFFYAAAGVFIFPNFLKTLPEEHLRSGLAEIIKIALISDAGFWRKIRKHPVNEQLTMPVEDQHWQELIAYAVNFKTRLIVKDYREKKLRKILNFGHTIGHALEALSWQENGEPLLHGEAVAAGMICASYLSTCKAGLLISEMEQIKGYLSGGFKLRKVNITDKPVILDILTHDKKNFGGQVRFTLISKPGTPVINVGCNQEDVLEAIEFYNN